LQQDGAEKKEQLSEEDAAVSCKRRCKSWGHVHGDGGYAAKTTTEVADDHCKNDDVTLELFPLRPQGKASC
jgi:hypothetical protein